MSNPRISRPKNAPNRNLKPVLRAQLRETFGFETLRPAQRAVVTEVMAGKNVLAILPTGAGKSLCYQLPAVELPGMTLVVSPLLALMKDQADGLNALGLRALELNSTLRAAEESATLERVEAGEVDFLFVTPERLSKPEFITLLKQVEIDLLVVDEAHCLSQWGHDFRPDYLGIGAARKALGDPQVIALTATATPTVVDEIVRGLGVRDLTVLNGSVYRENLHLEVATVDDDDAKVRRIVELLKDPGAAPAIVYTATVRAAESVHARLIESGIFAELYHGRRKPREREEAQEKFMSGQTPVIVATNAFGLGIDKPDIRLVVHHSMPASLESYYQEAGRAGRDGQPSRCLLLFLRKDKTTHDFLMSGRYPKPEHGLALYAWLAQQEHGASLAEAQVALDGLVPKTKVTVLAALLREAGILSLTRGRKLKLKPREGDEDRVRDAVEVYAERAKNDKERLKRVVMYGQSALCRWRTLITYFEEVPARETCGHCDSCDRGVSGSLPAPLA